MEGQKREWELEGNEERRRERRNGRGVGGGGEWGEGWEGAGQGSVSREERKVIKREKEGQYEG